MILIKSSAKIFFSIFLVVLCAACHHAGEAPKKTSVAVLLQTSANPFFQLMWEGIRHEAPLHDMDVDVYWPARVGDFDYQYDVLKNKASDYDVLIFAPSEPVKTASYLPAIKNKGAKIVLVDAGVTIPAGADQKDYFDVFTGTDNEVGGELAAEYAKRQLKGKGTAVVLAGFKETVRAPGRVKSFVDRVRKDMPAVELKIFTGDYDRDIAREVVTKNLDAFAGGDLIYCANDYMALGMLDAFRKAGVKRTPKIIGYDSMREAQKAILAGDMDASVVQFPTRMGREAVRIASALVAGERVPNTIMIQPKLSVRKEIIDTLSLEDVKGR